MLERIDLNTNFDFKLKRIQSSAHPYKYCNCIKKQRGPHKLIYLFEGVSIIQLSKIFYAFGRTFLSLQRKNVDGVFKAVLEGMQQHAQSSDNTALLAATAMTTSQIAPDPSDGDMSLTDKLLMAASLSNIVVTGHPIIADKGILLKVGDGATNIGILLTVVGIVTDSMALHDAIQSGDRAGIATSSVSLSSGAIGLGMTTTSLALAAKGLSTASAAVSGAGVVVAGITYGVGGLVAHTEKQIARVKNSLAYLGVIIKTHETPIIAVANSDLLLLHSNTVFNHIDIRNNRITLGDVRVKKNNNLTENKNEDAFLDMIDGFDINKQPSFNFDLAHPTLVLPLTGTIQLTYEIGTTITSWRDRNDWELQRLRRLYTKTNGQFYFYWGSNSIKDFFVSGLKFFCIILS
jgi:hypothetical protein